jgi:Ca-activated chloride channel family protein
MNWPAAEGLASAEPFVLIGLVLLPVYWRRRRRQRLRDRVPFAPLQFAARRTARRRLESLLLPLEAALLALALVALAGLSRSSTTELVLDEGVDVVFVLDVSLSMLAEDFAPNRMGALRRIVADFLARNADDRVALVIFAKDTYVQSPLTTDHVVLQRLLDGVTVDAVDQARSGGTAIGDALLVAADQLAAARVEDRDQAVILITDGESNEGVAPELAARHLRELDIRLYAVGIGGQERVEVRRDGRRIGENGLWTLLDEESLRGLADAGGGSFYRAADDGALEEVFAELSRLESAPLETRVLEHRHSLTPAFALALLVLFAAYVGLGAGYLRRPLR